MTDQNFELKYYQCDFCGLLVLGDKNELIKHVKTNEDCKIIQKKKNEEFKIFYQKCKKNIDIINDNVKDIQNLQLSEDQLKPNMGQFAMYDDEKPYKDDEDHLMVVNMYGVIQNKFSSYQKEREIFIKFDRPRRLFQFDFYKKKMIEKEKHKLTGKKFEIDYKQEEAQLFIDFTDRTLTPIIEEVYKKYKKIDKKT